MAVQGPTARPPSGAPSGAPTSAGPALTAALEKAGLLQGGRDPAVVGRELLKNLLSRGHLGGKGPLAKQVFTALSAFQKASGLPVTGRLDAATIKLLGALGLLPGPRGGAPVTDAFERSSSTRPGAAGGQSQASAPGAGSAPTTPDSLPARAAGLLTAAREAGQQLLGRLGLGGGGASAADGGAAASSTTGGGAEARAGAPQAANPQSTSANAVATRGQAADSQHVAQTRSDVAGERAPTAKGTEGAPRAEKGRGKPGDKQGRVGGGDDEEGSRGRSDGGGGADDEEREPGQEEDRGNASSGDDDGARPERGRASGEPGDDEEGHYRIPPLAEQMKDAIGRLRRDDARANRAATYSLVVTFYKPGVYGPGQKAEELLRAEVVEAEAFDDAWDGLVDGMRKLAARYEPDAAVPDRAAIGQAIRRARYRSS